MMMSALLLGGPPLVTNFFSGAVAATFGGYNQVGTAAQGKPAAGPQDMVSTGFVGANTRENQSDSNNFNIDNNRSRSYHASSNVFVPNSGQRGQAKQQTV